jgi:hypothetical protein
MTLRTYGPCTTCCAAALVGAATLFLACGASPAGGAARAPGADPSEGGVVAAQADAGPTTTTTLTLGDGGDLQGTKLGQSATTTVQTAIDGGPHGPHQQDPGRSPKDIQAIVVSRRDEARACYDAALKAHPGIEGDLDIQWTIDPKGNVTEIALDPSRSQILEPSVTKCISAIIKQIHFNESAKGFETHAHYPFNFHPRSRGMKVDADAGSPALY